MVGSLMMSLEALPLVTAPLSAPGSSGRVLVVDDEEPNRRLLAEALEAHGYQVLEAANGLQALQVVADQPADVILLDVMMPGIDGFEVCRRLKSDRTTAPMPVLMITALFDRRERLLGIEAGANDFLSKPVDLHDLILRVGNAVYTKKLFDELQAERQRSERLLFNALPRVVAQRMKQGEETIADQHPEVSVLVADLVGFTKLAAHISPQEVVSLLNEIFSCFDLLAEKYGVEKIKTMGDAYLVAGGLPLPRADHAEASAELALEMRSSLEQLNTLYGTSIQIRISIHTGPVVAGVIGRKKFAYDLWGDTVNTACRLEALTEPGAIQVSESTFARLRDKFRFAGGRTLYLKGRGQLLAYTLAGPLPARPSAAEAVA